MIAYTVHEPAEPAAERLERADSLVFVKEGFSLAVLLIAPLWFLAHRMWLVLIGYLAVVGLLHAGLPAVGVGPRPASLIMTALHILLALEADTLRRWTLARNGWHMIGSVSGRNTLDCERRFFEAWLPGEPFIRAEALAGTGLRSGEGPAPLRAPRTRWRSAVPFLGRWS
jgi:hypothetical protein